MNIEGQTHQKNPGMGQIPPPLPGNARILAALGRAIPPLPRAFRILRHVYMQKACMLVLVYFIKPIQFQFLTHQS